MKRHLSPQELSEWILNEPVAGVEEHLRECSHCRAEAAHLRATLTEFRGYVHAWSDGLERQFRLPPLNAWARPFRIGWGWAGLAASLCLLTVLSVVPRTHPAASADLADADAALLKQVDAEVSRGVPTPMEPLLRLVSWDGAAQSNSARTEKIN